MEDRTLDIEDKIFTLINKVDQPEKMVRNYEQNLQELWTIIKRTDLRIVDIEEGTEIQTKGKNNLFNDIISENFPNLKNEMEKSNTRGLRDTKCKKLQQIRTKAHYNENT